MTARHSRRRKPLHPPLTDIPITAYFLAAVFDVISVIGGEDLGWVLSVVIALLVSLGASFGCTLVYGYGFNVETAGDSPVWHKSETDVLPGEGADGGRSA